MGGFCCGSTAATQSSNNHNYNYRQNSLHSMKNTLLTLSLTLLAGPASAAVIFSDLGGGNGRMVVTEPLCYSINASGVGARTDLVLVFDENVTNDGSRDGASFSATTPIVFTLNGTPIPASGSSPAGSLLDGLGFSVVNSVTENDTYISSRVGVHTYSMGDQICLPAGTYNFTHGVGFNPLVFSSSPAVCFLTDGDGIRISANGVVVPEPAAFGLASLCGLALLRRKRA
jgi:MYXO-CTERM domain-containing protein